MNKLMSHFNIVPEEGGDAEKAKMEQALREFGKKKMAELFKSHKKRLRRLIKLKKTPDSEKVKNHWDEFVKYSTESEEFKRRSEINKANAALKLYHQILGPGGPARPAGVSAPPGPHDHRPVHAGGAADHHGGPE
jgi:hypothetical protein